MFVITSSLVDLDVQEVSLKVLSSSGFEWKSNVGTRPQVRTYTFNQYICTFFSFSFSLKLKKNRGIEVSVGFLLACLEPPARVWCSKHHRFLLGWRCAHYVANIGCLLHLGTHWHLLQRWNVGPFRSQQVTLSREDQEPADQRSNVTNFGWSISWYLWWTILVLSWLINI